MAESGALGGVRPGDADRAGCSGIGAGREGGRLSAASRARVCTRRMASSNFWGPNLSYC